MESGQPNESSSVDEEDGFLGFSYPALPATNVLLYWAMLSNPDGSGQGAHSRRGPTQTGTSRLTHTAITNYSVTAVIRPSEHGVQIDRQLSQDDNTMFN